MKKTAHVVIPIAELENLEIRNFRALSFFVHVDYMYKGSPVEVDQILVSTMIQEVYVDNNKLTNNKYNGILISVGSSGDIKNNEIKNNKVNGVSVADSPA